MNIDAKFFGIIVFLVSSIPAIEKAIEGLDVMGFRMDQLSKELEKINNRNDSIENQHSRLFDALQGNQIQQNTKGYGDY
jgi:hypothetical protein